jgi:hypothetical protein
MAPKCIICESSDLVASHLLPAALGRDVKGDGKEFWVGSSRIPGRTTSQSGIFDQLLCDKHEQATQKADAYAVKFVRAFELTDAEARDKVFHREATDNETLVRFVCSVLWRFHQSKRREAELVDVGDWEPNLRNVTFGGSVYQAPDVYMGAMHRSLVAAMPKDAFALTPEPLAQWGRRSIQFLVNGLMFVTKLDHEEWPLSIQSAVLNQTPDWISSHIWVWDERHFQGFCAAIKQLKLPQPKRACAQPAIRSMKGYRS